MFEWVKKTYVWRLVPQSWHAVFNLQVANGAPDLVLGNPFRHQVICLIVADIVSLCKILIGTALEITTDSTGTEKLIGVTDINQKVGVIKIKCDFRRQVTIKNGIFVQP